MPTDQRRVSVLLLICIVVLAASFRLIYLDHPFGRDPEGVSAYYGVLARNYFRFDFSRTLGVPVESVGKTDSIAFYPNHPPAVPLLIAAIYGIIGYRGGYDVLPPDWAVRLPAALFTLGDIVLIWLLVRRRASERAAILSAVLFASMPIALYYGGFADCVGSQLVFLILISVGAYLRFHDSPNFKTFGLLCLALLASALTDWPTFFLFPVIGLHFIFTQPRRRWGWIGALACFAVAMFAGLFFHGYLVTHDWRWMDRILLRRTMSTLADTGHSFGLWDWIVTCIWHRAALDHTMLVLVLLLLWGISLTRHRWRQWTAADRLAAILLGFAIVHIIVGRQGVYVHDWWWWPLTPGAAIASGLLIDRVLRRSRLSAAVSNAAIAVFLLLFAARNVWTTVDRFARPAPISKTDLNYTPREFGQVARQFTSPDSCVIFSEADRPPALWYYADRAIKRDIWDPKTFEYQLRTPTADLTFIGITQQCPAPPQAAIVPKAYASKIPDFVDYLKSRYPLHDTHKFLVFDLRRPMP